MQPRRPVLPPSVGSPPQVAPVPHWLVATQALVQNCGIPGVWSLSTVQAYALPRPRLLHSPPPTVQYLPTLRSLPGSPGFTPGPPPLDAAALELPEADADAPAECAAEDAALAEEPAPPVDAAWEDAAAADDPCPPLDEAWPPAEDDDEDAAAAALLLVLLVPAHAQTRAQKPVRNRPAVYRGDIRRTLAHRYGLGILPLADGVIGMTGECSPFGRRLLRGCPGRLPWCRIVNPGHRAWCKTSHALSPKSPPNR